MEPSPQQSNPDARLVAFDGCHNFRTVAGWRTSDGRRMASGKLYRSDGLDLLSDDDLTRLVTLGIANVFDLRAAAEIERAPSRLPEAVDFALWTGAESAAEADISALMKRDGLDAGAFHAAMCQVYARFPVDLADGVRALAAALLDGDGRPALVHCTAGKDRTGFAVAMLLHAIGIAADDVMADYLLSNASFDIARVRFNAEGRLDAVEARSPGALAALVGVNPDYLRAAERRIANDFGSIDHWLADFAGLDHEARSRLAERLLA